MKVIVTAEELGKAFDDAQQSLWNGKFDGSYRISVDDQVKLWKEKFRADVTGGHFNNIGSSGKNEWNTKDAIVEFEDEKSYVLFLLEWS